LLLRWQFQYLNRKPFGRVLLYTVVKARSSVEVSPTLGLKQMKILRLLFDGDKQIITRTEVTLDPAVAESSHRNAVRQRLHAYNKLPKILAGGGVP